MGAKQGSRLTGGCVRDPTTRRSEKSWRVTGSIRPSPDPRGKTSGSLTPSLSLDSFVVLLSKVEVYSFSNDRPSRRVFTFLPRRALHHSLDADFRTFVLSRRRPTSVAPADPVRGPLPATLETRTLNWFRYTRPYLKVFQSLRLVSFEDEGWRVHFRYVDLPRCSRPLSPTRGGSPRG